MFYILLFGFLAILLVVAGAVAMSRNKRAMHGGATAPHHPSANARQQRKAQRTQSKQARRKRH